MNFILPILLFAQLTQPYETKAFIDADGKFILYARYYQGELVTIDSVQSIYDYLERRIMARNRGMLLEQLKRDLVQAGGYASKGLFGTFEVPLPKGGFSDFMGETGKLDVGGHVKITLGGSETFMSNLPGENRPSLFPELEMKQEMAINLDGQVGDRMRVYIDHNSERVNETQNKITVTYKGREDEIIQEIEGGDTQLSIPATTYTGDIPSHKGLFGIKSTAKFGPLDVVAIASKEQTQTQEIEITGSAQSDTAKIWAKYFQRRRFFWLGTTDEIIEIKVYVDDNIASNNTYEPTVFGESFLDVDDNNVPDDTTNPTNYHEGYFTFKRQGLDEYYNFIPDLNLIELNGSLTQDYILGVWYRKRLSDNSIVTVGRLPDSSNTSIQLKLICPERLDTMSYTKNYERKNYYQIVQPGSSLDSLRIYYVTSGGEHKDRQNDIPYIEIFRLDENPEDGLVDENIAYHKARGLLEFPYHAEPFADSTLLDDPDPEIYTNPYMQGQGKYYIYVKTIQVKAVYNLPDNVEKVTVYVDDVKQDSLQDYHVDYQSGTLEFKKPILPTQQVRIKVEYAPFFSAAEKSLVGMRGTIRPFGDAALGSSFFYRTESYPAEHIRLREEPFNRMIWEVDFAYPQELPFLTRAVDWLPLVETESQSKFNVNFEGAYSFSNLNERGEVFLDDLESTTIISNEMPISKVSWVPCSRPAGRDTIHFVRQRLIWYNPVDAERLQASDIYLDPQDPNEVADVLKIVFRPEDEQSFGGLMQYIYSENFEEVENLELIIKGSGGRVHVDFGQEMSEDQMRRDAQGNMVGYGSFEDEDMDNNNVWQQQSEDTGLDGIFGTDGENITGDVGNDDYDRYGYGGAINGTELNRLWDTEDIDRNGHLNNENRYVSYSVALDDTLLQDSLSGHFYYIKEAGLHNGWKLFRIPIKDSTSQDTVLGHPDWHDIKFVRIWFDEFTQTETLFIYKISATGSRWKNYGILGDKTPPYLNEKFSLTPVNTKTHPYYQSPYGTEYDEFGRAKTEGGLEFKLENIQEGHTCIAHRLTDDNEDYRAYDTLTYYFHVKHTNPLIAVRIGSDSLNYYEYSGEYSSGSPVLNDYRLFTIALQNFLNLKRQRLANEDTISNNGYTVVGNPSLSKNQFFEVRIKNQYTTLLSDTMWFNDVKLTSPKTDIGRIVRGNGSITLADLATFSASYTESNGRFRRLSEPKEISTQSAQRGYAVNSTISLHKFLPSSWGFSMPLGLNYRNTVQEPRFSRTADDLEISEAERARERSRSILQSYSIHVSKSNSKNWFMKNTIDRLSFDHDRSQSFSRTALSIDTTDVQNYRGGYTLDPRFDVKLLRQTFSLLPKSISVNALYTDNSVKSYHWSETDSMYEASEAATQRRKTLNPTLAVTYSPHPIMNTTYNFSQSRDSVFGSSQFGEEVGRNQSLNASVTPAFLKYVSPRFNYTASYNEDYRFEIRRDGDYRNVSNMGRYGVEGQVNIRDFVKLFTRLRDESKDTLAVVGSPAWLAKQIEQLMSYVQNPSANWSRQRTSSYLNVMARPEPRYQWGLIDTVPSDQIAPGSFPGRSMNDMYGASSGINYKSFTINGGYNGAVNRTYNYSGIETRTNTAAYPNMTLRIMRLEQLPFLKKWCRQSSVTTSFNQTIEKRFEVNPDSTEATLISDSKMMSLSPLANWQLSWKNGISTTFEVNYSETRANDYGGAIVLPSRILNRGGSASFAYTFSAPKGLGLPFLQGVKFASNLSLNLNFSYNRSTSFYSNLEVPTSDMSTMGAMVGLSYAFSSSVTGGANFDYSENSDKNTEQETRRVSLNIWTNINF